MGTPRAGRAESQRRYEQSRRKSGTTASEADEAGRAVDSSPAAGGKSHKKEADAERAWRWSGELEDRGAGSSGTEDRAGRAQQAGRADFSQRDSQHLQKTRLVMGGFAAVAVQASGQTSRNPRSATSAI
jgi:hypothetical protein